MDIKDYYINKKSDIQIAKDNIIENIIRQQGLYDMYNLGQISIIESLVNCIEKEYCIGLLKAIIELDETSETIKKLSNDLIEKYSKEPKYEL